MVELGCSHVNTFNKKHPMIVRLGSSHIRYPCIVCDWKIVLLLLPLQPALYEEVLTQDKKAACLIDGKIPALVFRGKGWVWLAQKFVWPSWNSISQNLNLNFCFNVFLPKKITTADWQKKLCGCSKIIYYLNTRGPAKEGCADSCRSKNQNLNLRFCFKSDQCHDKLATMTVLKYQI